MDAVYIHLITNHIPVVGTALCLLLLLYGILLKKSEVKTVSAWALVLMALATWPVKFSGDESEEKVEHLAGVSEDAIEHHEKLADRALYGAQLAGVSALAYLWTSRRGGKAAGRALAFLFVTGIISFALMANTAKHGGHIRHTELGGHKHH